MAASLADLGRILGDNAHLTPEFVLVIFAFVILGVAYTVRDRRMLGWLSVIPIVFSLFLVSGMMGLLDMKALGFAAFAGPASSRLAGGALSVDMFSLLFKFVFL